MIYITRTENYIVQITNVGIDESMLESLWSESSNSPWRFHLHKQNISVQDWSPDLMEESQGTGLSKSFHPARMIVFTGSMSVSTAKNSLTV